MHQTMARSNGARIHRHWFCGFTWVSKWFTTSAMSGNSDWRVGFEVEVVLGDLNDPRFAAACEPMDLVTAQYCQAVAKRLRELTGRPWSAPANSKTKPGYYVLPEYDLDPLNWPVGLVGGVELLTPPLSLPMAEEVREEIVDAVEQMDGFINFDRSDLTLGFGWHINIDGGPEKHLDVYRYQLGVDELALLFNSQRYPSPYAAPQRHAYGVPLLRLLQSEGGQKLIDIDFANLLTLHSGSNKRFAANFGKLERGYLELRHYSTHTFFVGTPLLALLKSTINAFDMTMSEVANLERRLIARFQILKDWLDAIKPRLTHNVERCSQYVIMGMGEICFDGIPCARVAWNGSLKIYLLGNNGSLSEPAAITGQQYPDIYEALAILALDVSEIRSAKLSRVPLECRPFSDAISRLTRPLMAVT
jgi:hypothetical protein